MKSVSTALRGYVKPWFHKRNIIIISEQKVKHIPITGRTQFLILSTVISCICWASYSTGSFMAARSALKERTQTLRSVTNARVESNFSSVYSLSPMNTASNDNPTIDAMAPMQSEPLVTPTALDHNKLFARIAYLEYKLAEMKISNDAVIQRVRDKTSGRIDDLESIIKQTGLKPEELQKQASEEKSKGKHAKAEGGPYIPDSSISADEIALYNDLDKLGVLRQVVKNLPLATPITSAEEQSNFGHRIDPFTGHLAFHSGLDLAGPAGSHITAPAKGTVISAGRNGAYGNCIDIDHGFGITTRYGHLSEILVHEGQVVNKGDLIGIQGSTGRSTGPHLHYEVRYHQQPMNPKNFLTAGQYVSEE